MGVGERREAGGERRWPMDSRRRPITTGGDRRRVDKGRSGGQWTAGGDRRWEVGNSQRRVTAGGGRPTAGDGGERQEEEGS